MRDKVTDSFIKEHKIDEKLLFNANGLTVGKVKDQMKLEKKLFAFNTTPCKKGGHKLRDRYNHCIMCNTAYITFSKRTLEKGFIYIAGSLKLKMIKVGMTTEDLSVRLSKLNSRKVGGVNDWCLLQSYYVEKANRIELDIHKVLEKYQLSGSKNGTDDTESKELFCCSYLTAKKVADEKINEEGKSHIIDKSAYNFKNLARKL
ncbi:GIY-YIG nuclease family protein [Myroides marinus]|uniref:GIY-YIG nuclease family protein n=1 Tax=Myroides marinus TaxID=703342 RepID=UPI0025752591|nr:GIY-YIG nuclease family protein [Myroides marinus]MDM1350931.1 GIY-YIG nuclease family protein [Myroides marinus]MDM1358138.1 GIY-YIG nuclease family protein [Myroides marinus]